MTDEEVESVVLKFMANDDFAARGFVSLTSIHEKLAPIMKSDFVRFTKERLGNYLDQMVINDILQSKMGERGFERHYQITSQGEYEAAGFGDNLVADEFDEALPLAAVEHLQIDFDSTDWTGLSKKVSIENLKHINQKISALNDAILQSDADAQTKLNAIKRVEAVQALLEAPDVPWRAVVEILNYPSITAFLTALNIIQFIIGLAK